MLYGGEVSTGVLEAITEPDITIVVVIPSMTIVVELVAKAKLTRPETTRRRSFMMKAQGIIFIGKNGIIFVARRLIQVVRSSRGERSKLKL